VPDIRKHTITSDDEMVILGCDGIWEGLTNQQICDYVNEKIKGQGSVAKAVENLLDHILADDTTTGIGCDNMTCICLKLKWENTFPQPHKK